MKRPLELTVYPHVDRWVPWTIEYLGKPVSGESRECGYETARGVFSGNEFPEKRLVSSELAAEYHAWDALCRREQWIEATRYDYSERERMGQDAMYDRLNTIYRFATLPHYDEAAK